ncbi:MAG: Gfo/Idh/MocA family oxidoreductase, partial [Candidatus Gastranaerophilales bacterium]|nr:Gfo/Idh/MocA family oxidoreductase [Candidatus Gastranaerophilales bacterium]
MAKNIAVIGCGIWGRNLVRNFYNLQTLNCVCDLDFENLQQVHKLYPEVKCVDSVDYILNTKEIEGVIVATPSHTHYNLVKNLILAGKHVYVEKPIATSSKEAQELMNLANEYGKVLMVGHLLMYHPVVNRLRTLIAEGKLGKIKYVQSDRLNINYFRNDASVMWDLAPHDLSMISYILGKSPIGVQSATGVCGDDKGFIDMVHIDINYSDGILAHISNSWIYPAKHVILLVRGTKATAVLNDADPNNKLIIYDNYSQIKNQNIKTEEYIDIEPLKLECQHFISCIERGQIARSDGYNGFETVKIL